MSRILFLDDCPNRTRGFRSAVPWATCVETADDCVAALCHDEPWDVVFLDHDLGGETYVDSGLPNTGMAVVRHIEQHGAAVGAFVVHSLNGHAADNMVVALRRKGFKVDRIPFTMLSSDRFAAVDHYLGSEPHAGLQALSGYEQRQAARDAWDEVPAEEDDDPSDTIERYPPIAPRHRG